METVQSYIKLRKITTGLVYSKKKILSIILYDNSNVVEVDYLCTEKNISRLEYLSIFKMLTPLFNIKHNLSSHYEIELFFRSKNNNTYKWNNKYTGSTGCVVLGQDRGDKANNVEHELFDELIDKLLVKVQIMNRRRKINGQ